MKDTLSKRPLVPGGLTKLDYGSGHNVGGAWGTATGCEKQQTSVVFLGKAYVQQWTATCNVSIVTTTLGFCSCFKSDRVESLWQTHK